ncbi:MAG: hypothetical protein A2788_00700 [Candidatus Abawacabacteria bacterium RIFCSPHIGHO2_01_FULL_46_8]|uniref:Band 7 domain-containing protein n=1 Tax=Candidatus Abawacabacteria bacterium RIFCSPHIGHO2_01_FULL_46_8 TaxID=1817815 RepID=A0A1F4XIE8_9BACT|nr:MAG: hypothetical protein A2788_00700 [Candidatus Abawacabacteria bacterium RIFCSPHIGHO2_01_FULL_46_8]
MATIAVQKPGLKFFAWLIILLIAVLIITDGFISVPAGSVGVIYDRGRGVIAEELPEGLHLKIPLWQVATILDVRTQDYTMSAIRGEGLRYNDDSISAPTADGQRVSVDATVWFHIDPIKAANLYQKVGNMYLEKIIIPSIRSQIRLVISKYTAIDIYSAKREEAASIMTQELVSILSEKDIIVERVLLRDIQFTPEYATAIEQKQIAQQRIQKAEYERQEAEKLKEKKIIEASAEAEAIRLRGETLRANPSVIQYEFVQKMAPQINWGILPDGAIPLLDLSKLSK